MKIITLYRHDFKRNAEADFFADVCIALGLATDYDNAESIEKVELRVEDATVIS